MANMGKRELIHMQIKRIENEIRDTPYDKSTERHHGMLRAKLARLNEQLESQASSSSGGGGGYAVKKQGDATVVLVGPPSAGKSTLINLLTNAQSKVAPYAFTTVTVIPGMMKYNDAYIQILDVPGLIEGAEAGKGRGREVLSVVRGADLLVIMTDPARIKSLNTMSNELEGAGIRINKLPPEVIVKKLAGGGLSVVSNIKQDIDRETVREVATEFGVKNGEVKLRQKLTMDTLIDAFSRNRVYVPAIYIVNKVDQLKKDLDQENIVKISADKNIGIDELKNKIWETLNLVRVYLVKPNEDPNFESPMIMKKGQTLNDLAQKIGSEFMEGKSGAKIWGTGARFAAQEVSLTTQVLEGMQVRFV